MHSLKWIKEIFKATRIEVLMIRLLSKLALIEKIDDF